MTSVRTGNVPVTNQHVKIGAAAASVTAGGVAMGLGVTGAVLGKVALGVLAGAVMASPAGWIAAGGFLLLGGAVYLGLTFYNKFNPKNLSERVVSQVSPQHNMQNNFKPPVGQPGVGGGKQSDAATRSVGNDAGQGSELVASKGEAVMPPAFALSRRIVSAEDNTSLKLETEEPEALAADEDGPMFRNEMEGPSEFDEFEGADLLSLFGHRRKESAPEQPESDPPTAEESAAPASAERAPSKAAAELFAKPDGLLVLASLQAFRTEKEKALADSTAKWLTDLSDKNSGKEWASAKKLMSGIVEKQFQKQVADFYGDDFLPQASANGLSKADSEARKQGISGIFDEIVGARENILSYVLNQLRASSSAKEEVVAQAELQKVLSSSPPAVLQPRVPVRSDVRPAEVSGKLLAMLDGISSELLSESRGALVQKLQGQLRDRDVLHNFTENELKTLWSDIQGLLNIKPDGLDPEALADRIQARVGRFGGDIVQAVLLLSTMGSIGYKTFGSALGMPSEDMRELMATGHNLFKLLSGSEGDAFIAKIRVKLGDDGALQEAFAKVLVVLGKAIPSSES